MGRRADEHVPVETDLAAAACNTTENLLRLHAPRLMIDAHVGIVLLLAIGDRRAMPMQTCTLAGVGDENGRATRYGGLAVLGARDLREVTFTRCTQDQVQRFNVRGGARVVLPAREVQFGVLGESEIKSEIGDGGGGVEADVALDQGEFGARVDLHFDRGLSDMSCDMQDFQLHALTLQHAQSQGLATSSTIEVQIIVVNRCALGRRGTRIDAQFSAVRQGVGVDGRVFAIDQHQTTRRRSGR